MGAAEGPLPAVACVVRLGQGVQRIVVRGQRAGAVACEVAAHDAQVRYGAGATRIRGHGLCGSRGHAAPGGVGVKAAPFIQQHALGAFQQDGARPVQALRNRVWCSRWAGGDQGLALRQPALLDVGIGQQGPFGL